MGNGFHCGKKVSHCGTTTREKQGSEVSLVEMRLREGASRVSAYILPCQVWL
jgi:hypothetical protein